MTNPNEQQPTEPIMEQMPYSLPQYPQEDTAGLISQLDPVAIVEEVKHQLRGEEQVPKLDKEGRTVYVWLKKRKKPLINEEGIASLMVNVRLCVNQSTVMGKTDDEDIPKLMNTISDTVISKLMMNREKFDVDKAELDTITDLICIMSYIALRRSHNALTIGLMKKATQEHIISKQNESKKGGMFGLLKKQ